MATTSQQSPTPTRMMWDSVRDLLPTLLTPFAGILVALVLIIVILQVEGADPGDAWTYLYEGTLAEPAKRADVAAFWMPLAMASFGLVLTFNAGLWNIGVEGQMIMGAIGATYAVRLFAVSDDPPLGLELGHIPMMIVAFVFAALAAGAWALIVALLRTKGGVNEIFGGVALNFIAQTFNLYLISNGGPWQPVGSRATETAVFPDVARLTQYSSYRQLSLTPVYISLGTFLLVALIMYVSRWGLQIRAMGKSPRSAFVLGVRTERNVLLVMALCGAMAGVGGAFRVLGPAFSRAKLTANPAGGIGFLGILVVLLASNSALLTPFVSGVFAVLSKGAEAIENRFTWEQDIELHRSLVRVLQSLLVLLVVLAFGVRNRLFPPRSAQPIVDEAEDTART